ncbi:MAG: BrnT family toxin [Betaproteobacteria bacterium]|nr:BrnT family toxin [Betaproteobacteria bacterium]
MKIEFDPAKNAANIRDRGLSFERAAEFDFESALIRVDDRRNYGEIRFRSIGLLDGRIHVLVFVEITSGIRVISFRKANKREVRDYEQET